MKKILSPLLIILVVVLLSLTTLFCNSKTSVKKNENNKNNVEKGISHKVAKKNSCISSIEKGKRIRCNVNVIREIPHNGERSFTQGFVINGGYLYESTGRYDGTALKKIDLATGNVINQKNMEEYFSQDELFFGEGITIWKDKIIQLSWKKGKAYLYDLDFNKLDQEFSYKTEGWGITHDGKQLIMTDGSPYIYFRDPETFDIIKDLNVGIKRMNEIEYVDGFIFANVWMENYIIVIDPQDGEVLARIDAKELLCCNISHRDGNAVLNGISYDSSSDTFYITGKLCPIIYEVTLDAVG